LRCLDGLVNNFNETIILAIRCNMDIKFIGSGPSTKAVIYYITDYITKSQLKTHVAFAALELAVKKLNDNENEYDLATTRAKRLLQKCAYAMVSHQELSAQQVCSYLMDFEDHFTSHEYRNIFWKSFEIYVDWVLPLIAPDDSESQKKQMVTAQIILRMMIRENQRKEMRSESLQTLQEKLCQKMARSWIIREEAMCCDRSHSGNM